MKTRQTAEEVIEYSVNELVSPHDKEFFRNQFKEVLQLGEEKREKEITKDLLSIIDKCSFRIFVNSQTPKPVRDALDESVNTLSEIRNYLSKFLSTPPGRKKKRRKK